MIIMDLEWNRGYDTKPLNELLQIGAVRMDSLNGPIADVFNIYIRPSVHKKFDMGAKKLPELRQSQDSHLSFPEAVEQFRTWCGGEAEFAVWGNDDFQILNENCAFWKLPLFEPSAVFDLQAVFSRMVGGEGVQIALWRAVAYRNIPEIFDYHNALNDALYTALVCEGVTRAELTYVPPPAPSLPKFSDLSFPAQPRVRVGPAEQAETLLNDPKARKTACPLCGKEFWVQQWAVSGGRQFYSLFRCPEHGRFLCRLTVSPDGDGRWRGRVTVPELTQDVLSAYRSTLKSEPIKCRGTSKSRRRRRSRRKSA